MSALLLFLQVITPALSVYAAATVSNDIGSSASLDPVGNKATRLQMQGSSGVDQSSGALTYSYPITLPEGRNGMAPKLSLSYNSQNNDSGWIGYGWTLNIPYIERTTKRGSDKLYSNPTFVSSLHGELTSSNGINYEQKVDDGSWAKYTYTGNTWQMTDRDGTTYYFGNTYYSRIQDDAGTKIGRWYLTEVRDKFGNGITYTYIKDSGTVYPGTISYTEHAMAHPLNLVTFTLENKNDQLISYKYGFKTTETKRISAIKVSTSGKDNSYFYFEYTTGSNGVRSLLQSVEEKHLSTNGDWTTLPKATFEYEKSVPSFSGTISNSSNPYGSYSVMDTDNNGILELYNAGDGYFPVEINGDYKKDLVQSEINYGAYSSGEYINFKYNQGGTFFLRSLKKPQAPAYIRSMVAGNPIPPLRHMGENEWWWTQESVVTDVNGDGFDDVVYNDRYGSNGAGINTTNNTFDYSTSTNLWFNITNDQLADVNGDGLQDKISKSYTSTSTVYSIYLNNGSSYATSTYYVFDAAVASSTYDLGVRFVDINNDGLADIVRAYYSNYSGSSIGLCPGGEFSGTAPRDQTVNTTYLNTGISFTSTTTPISGYFVTYVKCNDGWGNPYILTKSTKEYDTNGDLDTDYDSVTNTTTKQDVLKKVNSSLGSTLDVSYTWTTASGLNPTLPVPMYTVGTTTEKLSSSDTNPHIVSYSFQDGQMYFDEANPRDHKFAGFGKVEVVDGKKKTVTYFHQGNGDSYTTGEKDDSYYNIGRAYRVDTFDNSTGSSTLISKDLSLYKTYSYASSSFTYLDSQIQDLYNSDGTYESSGSKNVYDETKRLIKTTYNYGDIEPFISFASSTISDKGSDLTTTSYEYSNTRPQRLVKQTVTDYAGQVIGSTVNYYDGLPYGLVDKGAVTSIFDTVYRSDGTVNSTSTTQTEYDPTGNAIKTTDNLGRITRVVYDSTYYFPVQKVDALNGTTTYTFDLYTLNLLTTKGPDSITYAKETDGLGKVTRSYTLDSGGGMYDEVKTNYVYGGGISVYSRKMGTGGQNARSVEIYDSFGRLIQSKKETTEDVFSTQDTTYDANSNVISTSLPYTTTGYGYTTDTPTNGKTVYTYDGLGRVTSKESFGTRVVYAYGARSLTAQDNASTQHKKTYVYDANGNVSQVKEYNGGNTYTTNYTYTSTNKLSRITDANGNIRNFSYLSNGLLTYQEDPHPTTDTTYTTYSYTYDSLGNLTTKTGPLGTLTYSYDSLNRPTSRILVDSNYGTSTVSIAYTGCSNNYTSPCTINRGTSSTTLAYNASGKLSSETLSIDGKTFARSYGYDTFGNPTTVTYPDNGQAVYTYTLDGKQASLSYVTPSGATKTIANNATWNSMGALSSLTLGNGIQMCNTYTSTSADGAISPRLAKSVYLFNSTGCSLSGSNQIELYKDEFTYKDNLTPSNILSTYKDIAGTTHTKSDTFTYDNLARLTQVSTSYDGGSAVVDALVYDPIGNIISENDVLYRYSKDGMQNAHAVTSIGGTNISYDAQGNRIQVGDNAYAWNALNQLVIATSTNGTETYTYDENGERIKKVVQASTVINQKVTPATSGLAINALSQGDLLASVATSSTYIATSTYNTLSSLSLLDKPTLLALSTVYYSSPFTSKFCAATSTANRQSCIAETTKQLLANDINGRSTSTIATNGLITDIIKISTGEYLIPTSYVGIATSSIATSDPSVFSVNSGTISSYNTYVATGIVVALDEYSNLPYVSTSTYNALASIGLTDTTKVRAVMTLAGCDSVVSACATTKKVIFEKYYKESGYLLSDRALQEMWYVYAAKARLPGNSTELTATSTYLGNITVPTITSRSTSAATSTYYSTLYFNTEYTNQNNLEPRLQYFNTIPYYVTTTAFSELNTAGITQTTIENYKAQIGDILNIRYASSTEYMVALRAFANHDKNVTLSWDTLKELYLVVLGAATIPNNATEYTDSSVYDLASYLTVQTVYGTYANTLSNTTTGCQGGWFQISGTNYFGRCKIRVSPFSLPVATSSTVTYKLSVTAPHVTDFILNAGESTNPTYAVDNYNYGTQLPVIYASHYAPATSYGGGMGEYTSGTISSNGWTQTIDVTSTVVKQKASSTDPAIILLMNRSGWTNGQQYAYESLNTSIKAYADTPHLTLASTTLVSGVTNATTTSFTSGIESTISSYFGENHDSSYDISTGTSSPIVFISPETAVEVASTTLKDAYQLTRVFMATSTSPCAVSASTTECDKTLRKAAFREIITNLSGFTPSEAATEEFWMVYKGILTLPNINYASTTATTTVAGYYQATSTTGAWYYELSPGYYTSEYTATSTASTTITIINSQNGGTTFTPGTGSQYVLAFCGSYCSTPTFNGVAMTNIVTKASPNTNSDVRIFGIATTTSGSVSVTSNCGTYCGNATDHYRWISLKGLDTSSYYYDTRDASSNSASSLSVTENIQDKNNLTLLTSNISTTGTSGGTGSSPLTATTSSRLWYHYPSATGNQTYTVTGLSGDSEIASIQMKHDPNDTVTPGYYTSVYHATTTTYYIATSSAMLPSIVSSTSTPYPVFSRSNFPISLSTTTAYYTTIVPGFWVDQVIYQDRPTGGATSTSGSYTIHTFTSGTSTFTAPSSFSADILVVGGGGGGGGWQGGGGGGGQFVATTTTLSAQTYTIVIGAGGLAGDTYYDTRATNGGNSSFGSTTAIGGGHGGAATPNGSNGGSGGGAGYGSDPGSSTVGQGNGGTAPKAPPYTTGGGGGAGGNGSNGATGAGTSGNGGVGIASSISGTSTYYGGGGGGSASSDGAHGKGTGGNGGGGNGADYNNSPSPAQAGTSNTGGGGGGNYGTNTAGSGGSGVVIVRYLTSLFPSDATTTQRVYIATTTVPTLHLNLVPPGLLTSAQFNGLYSTSSFALATSTKVVSQDTYNELLKTPIRLSSDVRTVFAYALPYATSSCPGEAATSTCVVAAQKTKVKDTISAMSGFVFSNAALEELRMVNSGDLSIVPISLANAATSSASQTVIVPLVTSQSFKTFATSTATGTTTASSLAGSCSFGISGATTSACYIGLPYINSPLTALTFKYDVSTSTVSTSTVTAYLSYSTQTASTTGATSTPQFVATTATSTVTGQKSGSTFTFDLGSLYQTFLSSSSSVLTLIPDANGTSTQVYTLSNPILTLTRSVVVPNISYGSSTQFSPFDRSTISSYATTTATTTVDLTNAPSLELTGTFLSPVGIIALTSSYNTTIYVASSSLSAYYKLDESSGNATDSTGNGNTLTNSGTVAYSTGKINNGAVFNNSATKHLKVESNLGLTSVSSSTVNFWVKPSSLTGYLLDWFTQSGAQRRYIIYFDGAAGKLRTYFSPNDNAAFGPSISTGNWYMVTLVITSGSTFELFVNGTSYGQVGSISSSGAAINRFSIGGAADSDGAPADATFDEVGVWNRALTSTEIASLYNTGSGREYPFQSTTLISGPTTINAGSVIDPVYHDLPPTPQVILPAVGYPFQSATSTATSTIYNLTTATTTSYIVYSPFSNFVDASSTVTTYFTFNGKLIGAYTYEKGNEASTGKVTYALTNYLGTPVLQTDVNGDIVEMDITDVFGNYVHRDQRNDNALHTKAYTSHEFDDITGLTYAHARYLDTKLHSFLSVDPMIYRAPKEYLTDPQQMNSYTYARTNPIIYIDPTGMFNIKTGEVEEGDTLNKIVNLLNKTNGTNYTATTLKNLNPVIKDINKIYVGQVLIPNQKTPDVTRSLTETMKTNAKDSSIQSLPSGPSNFYNKVKTGGVWDFKNDPSSSYYSYNDKEGYVFNGKEVGKDAPGNIHYGYVGYSTNWGSPILLLGTAGAAQVKSNYDSTREGVHFYSTFLNFPYFDNPGDSEQIQMGIDYYKNGN